MGFKSSSLESVVKMVNYSFYKGKKVFVTGHTGFKGTWLCRILLKLGAEVTGYSLEPSTNPNVYRLSGVDDHINSIIGDIRDIDALQRAFQQSNAEIVLHLAAQPLVRDSYVNPRYTYETNVMGTVNILECLRRSKHVSSFLNVTTDKVYENKEWVWGYREDEPLDGFDPYSNSKSCSELVTHSYKNSFFQNAEIPISTARAGNVIGGGDFSNNRIIPDCVRAQLNHEVIIVRNPNSTRPYQHVLEPLFAYLMIAEKQCSNYSLSGWYNVGPDDCDCVTTGQLVDLFCQKWGDGATWQAKPEENAPHEANFLKLDCSKIKNTFAWHPRWHIEDAIEKTCEWSKSWINKDSISYVMDRQIEEYMEL